ncbi:hybrid sensor histidine kinase/response regulator transcription factor [Flammeovirga kamogawensis]|nr:helix-turn-helix domain-containing protein [Flammeovirga kamogawensis]TRX63740.1 helix-turn-helix domain-containing protein [Flammeovirga kamogawensis]
MRQFFKFYTSLLLVFLSLFCSATPLKLANFSGSVTNIMQDSEGYIWFATWDGLYKYDGYQLTTFGEREYKPLLDKKISAVMEHSDGTIWIGTDNNGIFIYHKSSDSFEHLTEKSESARSLGIKRITSFAEDNLGNVWIGTQGNGLGYYSKSDGIFKIYTRRNFGNHFNAQIFQDLVLSVHYDHNGYLWFGTMQGLACLNIKTFELSLLTGKPFVGVYSIYQSESNDIWCSNMQGIFIAKFQNKALSGKVVKEIENNNKSYITPSLSQKNKLWYMTSEEVYAINTINYEVNDFQKYNSKSGFSAILEDRSGTLWVGTHFGVYMLDLFQKPIYPLFSDVVDPVVAIGEANDKVWVGTITGKLYFETPNYQNKNKWGKSSQRFEQISAIVGRNNNVWVAAVGLGIYKLDNSSGKVKKFYSRSNELMNPYIMTMALNNYDGSLWGGSWDAGLTYYSDKDDRFYDFKTGLGRELFNTPIIKILPVSDEEVWIGTRGQGLWKLQYKKGFEITKLEQFNVRTPTMNTSLISDIIEYDNNSLLVATENGLFKFLRDKKHFSQKDIPNKLAKATISSIEKEKDNTIWGTTLTYVFEWKGDEIYTYTEADGLSNERYFNNAKLYTSKGDILFGGEKGVDVLNVINFNKNPYDVTPIITNFYLKDHVIHPKELVNGQILLADRIQNLEQINLKHDQNSFGFSLSSLNYSIGDKKVFTYKLEGLDKDWITAPNGKSLITYTGLMPGNYTFVVKALNVDGKISSKEVKLKVNISPIWYRTTLAYVIYTISLIGILFLSMVWWRRKVLQANRDKYEHLKIRDEKIEYERKVNFFTNLSHELRTPLTLVLGPIEQISKNETVDVALQEPLGIAYRNAQRLLRLTDQLMFLTKSQHGQIGLNIKEEEIKFLLKDATDAFKHIAKRKGINYTVQLPIEDEGRSIYIDKVMLEAVLYNVLSNAFKYNVNNGGVWVNASLCVYADVQPKFESYQGNTPSKYSKQYLSIEIKDSGIGINKNDLAIIFDRFYQVKSKNDTGSGIGLAFAKSIIEVMNGIIYVESEPSLGSKFTLLIPADIDFYSKEQKEKDNLEEVSKLLYSTTEKLEFNSSKETTQQEEKVEKQELVLIVEKSTDIKEYIASILGKKYKIMYATNGLEAYEKVLKYFPSLVIAEIYLEQMDGLQLSQKIKSGEKTKNMPIILLSSNPDTQERIKTLEAGADSFISKPFTSKHIEVRVEQLLKVRANLSTAVTTQNKAVDKNKMSAGQSVSFEDQARKIVEGNISEIDFSVPELAKIMDMSTIQLYRKMKTETGMPPVEFVRNIRLQKALELLKTSELNISEIAYEVGFNDPQYFRKSFKKQFGQTPTQYRKPIK